MRFIIGAVIVTALTVASSPVLSQTTLRAQLDGLQEVPPVHTGRPAAFKGRSTTAESATN
jgi:hypothetical protein